MNTRITQKLVAEVKRMEKQPLHPHSWHDFMSRPDVNAIRNAIERTRNNYKTTNAELAEYAQAILAGDSSVYISKIERKNERFLFVTLHRRNSGLFEGTFTVPKMAKWKILSYLVDNAII